MEMNKKTWALPTICRMEKRIDPTPDYQRPPAWTQKQKQLLMDTILRNYDIPKFYWRKVQRDDDVQYEVVDGQQRLRAIWEFYHDTFALAKNTDPIDGHEVAGLKFSMLPDEVMEIFDTYSLDVVVIVDAQDEAHEDEVRDMFLRLQNGTTLKAQEKRNAMTGQMRNFVTEIAKHKFFENCKFANRRFTFDHIAAQCILLELNGGPANVKDANLNTMYTEYKTFSGKLVDEKKIRKVFDFLTTVFPEKTPELERYSVITLYSLASNLIANFVLDDSTADDLATWFLGFEKMRKDNDAVEEEQRDLGLAEYRRLISQSTDAEESIRARLETMERYYFLSHSNIELKDPSRDFSHEQRLAIFRKDRATCQLHILCDGAKLSWDNWHADHILPHSRGGKTTVENGQVACIKCNLSKGANIQTQ